MPVPVFFMTLYFFITFQCRPVFPGLCPYPVKIIHDLPIRFRLVLFDSQHKTSALPDDFLHDLGLRTDRIYCDYTSGDIQQFQQLRNRGDLTVFLFHRHLGKDEARHCVYCIQYHWRPVVSDLVHRRAQCFPVYRQVYPFCAHYRAYPFHKDQGKEFLIDPGKDPACCRHGCDPVFQRQNLLQPLQVLSAPLQDPAYCSSACKESRYEADKYFRMVMFCLPAAPRVRDLPHVFYKRLYPESLLSAFPAGSHISS